MILLNRRNHHVVENHIIEIHVRWGTTVYTYVIKIEGIWIPHYVENGIIKKFMP